MLSSSGRYCTVQLLQHNGKVGEQKGIISSFQSNRSSMWSHASDCPGELFSSWTKSDGKCGSGPIASTGWAQKGSQKAVCCYLNELSGCSEPLRNQLSMAHGHFCSPIKAEREQTICEQKKYKISQLWDNPLRWYFVVVDVFVTAANSVMDFLYLGMWHKRQEFLFPRLGSSESSSLLTFFLSLISVFLYTFQWSPFVLVIRRFLIMPNYVFSMPDTKARATVQPWRLWGQQIGWQISAGKHASSWNVVQTSLALRWCWINVRRTALSWQRQNTVSSSLIHTKVEFGVLYFSFFWLWLQKE